MRPADLDARIAKLTEEIAELSKVGFSALYPAKRTGMVADSQIIREAMDQRWQKIQERAALIREQEAPLLADLKKRGIVVDTIGQLANSDKAYNELLPLLFDHFCRNYHDDTKMAIMLVIARSDARPYWPALRTEFKKGGPAERAYDAALANAFLNTATLSDVDEIVDLIDNSRNPSRLILLHVLRKYRRKSAKAHTAIQRLAKCPEFAKEISSWPKPKCTSRRLATEQ